MMNGSSGQAKAISRLEFGIKFWLKKGRDINLGGGIVNLLKYLEETENLTHAAEKCSFSYKFAWQRLKNLSKESGRAVVVSQKGGKGGGGTVKLTPWGKYLIEIYEYIDTQLTPFSQNMQKYLDDHPFLE